MAVALSGNLLGISAQEAAVIPGEQISGSPAPQVAADGSFSDHPARTPASRTETTDAPPTDAPPPETTPLQTPAEEPAEEPASTEHSADDERDEHPDPAAAEPAGAPDSAGGPDAVDSTEQPGAEAAAPGEAPTPAPAAPDPAATQPAPPPARPADPLPFAGVAGPADRTSTARVDCRRRGAVGSRRKHKPSVEGESPGSGARATGGARCKQPQRTSRRAVAPQHAELRDRAPRKVLRNAQGVPTISNPTTSLALPGAVAVGVPNFFIDKFRIPPFLLPIYQAAGIQYGIRWEVLAAINEIETDYGRNLNISSAGALGWMQFMPATWKAYGTDANRDGRKDPFNPVDAIFAAARYLRAAGADSDLRKAIFAYNHADWYVESVLMRARLIGGLPADLVGSLSGLTQGHFPIAAKARYADDISERTVRRRLAAGQNVANPVDSEATRRGIDIFAKPGSPAIAVQDATIVAVGASRRLGSFVRLRDVYGNTYTYGRLKKVAEHVPVPRPKTQSRASIAKELALPRRDPKPTLAASAGRSKSKRAARAAAERPTAEPVRPSATRTASVALPKERLFANPGRRRSYASGGAQQIRDAEPEAAAAASLESYFSGVHGLDPEDVVLKPLTVGRKVIAGTILGRIGRTDALSSRLHFEIRPAGRGAPRIDPKPILDGWKLLESTAIYRARGRNPLVGADADRASIGQILLMSKEALAQRVLANPRIEIYSCGRRDIAAGGIDRRVLAMLEFLATSGLKPTITSLTCGHGYYTASGNVSAHSSGNAVDIAKINGIPILGHQGEGSISDITIRRLLTLQGTIKPNQIISLMTYAGTDNTLAMGDHADHIHVGFRPRYQEGTAGSSRLDAVLKPSQWIKLIDRLGRIDNPDVAVKPSKYAIRVPVPRASIPHRGE